MWLPLRVPFTMRFPSRLPITPLSRSSFPCTCPYAPMGIWHPPSRWRRRDRSAVTVRVVGIWWRVRRSSSMRLSPFLISIAKAPWPTAGSMISNGRISVIRCAQPSRVTPALARIIPSQFDSSSFFIRVLRFPRISIICMSCRTLSTWHLRRRLPVAITAWRGRAMNNWFGLFGWPIKTSRTSSRSRTAPIARPSGIAVGTSLKLCTARSMRSSNRATSSSFVKSPFSPIFASGASRILSPVVLIVCTSMTIPEKSSSKSAFTWRVCQSASSLPRVPMRTLLGMRIFLGWFGKSE